MTAVNGPDLAPPIYPAYFADGLKKVSWFLPAVHGKRTELHATYAVVSQLTQPARAPLCMISGSDKGISCDFK